MDVNSLSSASHSAVDRDPARSTKSTGPATAKKKESAFEVTVSNSRFSETPEEKAISRSRKKTLENKKSIFVKLMLMRLDLETIKALSESDDTRVAAQQENPTDDTEQNATSIAGDAEKQAAPSLGSGVFSALYGMNNALDPYTDTGVDAIIEIADEMISSMMPLPDGIMNSKGGKANKSKLA